MQLLVSVRSAAEAGIALAGGADIIDAKEPSRGSLGAVSSTELLQICQRIPADQPISIALGDVATASEVLQGIAAVPRSLRPATYLKLGFAGIAEPEVVHQLLRMALDSVAGRCISIITVAYADAVNAASLHPEMLCRITEDVGVAGLLLDTYQKSDRHLFTWLDHPRLSALLARARAAGLLTALAGGLGVTHLAAVRALDADVVGFRGAVCVGGREGSISRRRVRSIQRQLSASNSAFIRR